MMTFRDLLYGFMLTSGNDGANAIAVMVNGCQSKRVDGIMSITRSLAGIAEAEYLQ